MILSRKRRPILNRVILSFFKLSQADRFKPDVYVEDGDDLAGYGFHAQVLHLPGHSNGSIGILTTDPLAERALFCGDLFTNNRKPVLNSLMDDPAAARTSVERLKKLVIKTVYPGHGKPFPMETFIARLGQTQGTK